MTKDELRRWTREAYERGCNRNELEVLADAYEETGRDLQAERLRLHALGNGHFAEPCICIYLRWALECL